MTEEKQKQKEVKETADVAVCSDCEKLKAELADCSAGRLRALADYQNLTKETEKRRAEWADYAKQMILEEFIPIYDNLKAAFAAPPSGGGVGGGATEGERKGWEQWREGIKHIMKQFAEVLKNHGVEEIKTVGEKFDPALHEAVGAHEPESLRDTVQGSVESGMVVKEISGGYKMGERVIRAAKVIVAK